MDRQALPPAQRGSSRARVLGGAAGRGRAVLHRQDRGQERESCWPVSPPCSDDVASNTRAFRAPLSASTDPRPHPERGLPCCGSGVVAGCRRAVRNARSAIPPGRAQQSLARCPLHRSDAAQAATPPAAGARVRFPSPPLIPARPVTRLPGQGPGGHLSAAVGPSRPRLGRSPLVLVSREAAGRDLALGRSNAGGSTQRTSSARSRCDEDDDEGEHDLHHEQWIVAPSPCRQQGGVRATNVR